MRAPVALGGYTSCTSIVSQIQIFLENNIIYSMTLALNWLRDGAITKGLSLSVSPPRPRFHRENERKGEGVDKAPRRLASHSLRVS